VGGGTTKRIHRSCWGCDEIGDRVSGWSKVLAELVASRGTALKRYGYLLCGDQTQAADLVQEALVRTFARPRVGWNVPGAERYVRQAMLNCFLDQHRRQRRWALLKPRLADPSTARDAAAEVIGRLDMRAALASLPPRQRACVVLRYYEDLKVEDIAERLGCSSGTVKRQLSDAQSRLGTLLGALHAEG